MFGSKVDPKDHPKTVRFDAPSPSLKAGLRLLRPHQWAKNVLLFVPLFLAHRYTELALWLSAVAGFAAFSLTASGVYVLNDLLDLEHDRLHPEKRHRPLAAGRFSLLWAAVLALTLPVLGLSIAASLSWAFLATLASYYLLTMAYSFALKRLALVDVFVLGTLYTWRVIAGGVATNIELSFWLLGFSFFFFLGLAFAKRVTELKLMADDDLGTMGRGYAPDDLPMIENFGVASSFASILIFALYIQSNHVASLYGTPTFLWPTSLCLMYWCARIWLLTHRGQMLSDPVAFALKDRVSYVVLGCIALLLGLSRFV